VTFCASTGTISGVGAGELSWAGATVVTAIAPTASKSCMNRFMRASVEDCAALSRQDCAMKCASYTRHTAMDNLPSANRLGLAQYLRHHPGAATTLLLIGAVLAIGGAVVAMGGRSRKS
jgi:hypothetical protein